MFINSSPLRSMYDKLNLVADIHKHPGLNIICSDLSIKKLSFIEKIVWHVFARIIPLIKSRCFNVNLKESRDQLENIFYQIELNENDMTSDECKEIKKIYNLAVRSFNKKTKKFSTELFFKTTEKTSNLADDHFSDFSSHHFSSEAVKSLDSGNRLASNSVEPEVDLPDPGKAVSSFKFIPKNSNEKQVFAAYQAIKTKEFLTRLNIKQPKATPEIVEEAKTYLKNVRSRMKKGENVPIPYYYHATKLMSFSISFYSRETLFGAGGEAIRRPLVDGSLTKQILESKRLKNQRAVMGNGVYVSTNDEDNNGYGKPLSEKRYGGCTIAFDPTFIENQEAFYFNAQPANELKNREKGLWISIQTPEGLPLDKNKVACFIVREKQVVDMSRLAKEHGFDDIPIIQRKTANVIRFALQEYERKLPHRWKVHQDYAGRSIVNISQGRFS